MLRIAVVVWCVILLSVIVANSSEYFMIGLYADPVTLECGFADLGPGILHLHVVVSGLAFETPEIGAIEFAAPVPECLVGGTFVSDSHQFAVTMGDSQNGIGIGFGPCIMSAIHVLTINVQVQGLTTACCLYDVLAHPEAGYIRGWDCDLEPMTGYSSYAYITHDGAPAPPVVTDRAPPDGAITDPNVTLRWTARACNCLGWDPYIHVYFGTNENPPCVFEGFGDDYALGTLAPRTTYYWKIGASSGLGGGVATPVWSFTTGGVPVAPSSWGKIKSLYGG